MVLKRHCPLRHLFNICLRGNLLEMQILRAHPITTEPGTPHIAQDLFQQAFQVVLILAPV